MTINEKDLIEGLSLHDGVDSDTGELMVDRGSLLRGLKNYFDGLEEDTIFEGHLSYLAPYDLLIILRLDPKELRSRLMQRNYKMDKIKENVEAEAVSSVLVDSLSFSRNDEDPNDKWSRVIVEKDITGMEPEEIADWAMEMISAWRGKEINTLTFYRPGKVDWLEAYSPWY